MQPEPAEFNARVRQRGNAWITKHNLDKNAALPEGMDYPKPAYWAKQKDGYSCLEQLYLAYQKICAYTGLFISVGAKSVDHFVPKSRLVGLAFEWGNYRLACKEINGLKNNFEDVLDPFELVPETFFLVLITGKIYVNPNLEGTVFGETAKKTIDRLHLGTEQYQTTRADYYLEYKRGERSAENLKKYAPFVYSEAKRQGLLPLET